MSFSTLDRQWVDGRIYNDTGEGDSGIDAATLYANTWRKMTRPQWKLIELVCFAEAKPDGEYFNEADYGLLYSIAPNIQGAFERLNDAHPAFTARFQDDMSTPGLRIPVAADGKLFAEAVEVGRKVIWLHTFGERMTDSEQGRPAQPPRLPAARAPRIPIAGAIPESKEAMPDTIDCWRSKRIILKWWRER